MMLGLLVSACMWAALLVIGAAALGLLQLRVQFGERCLVLRGLRLPDWLLRPIRQWLRTQLSPIQLEALAVDAVEIGWSAKGCMVVGLRGIRLGLTASCEGLEAAGAEVAVPAPTGRPKSRKAKAHRAQGAGLPSGVGWLLAHLQVRIKDVSVALAYDMRELGGIGGERALVCSLEALRLEPKDDGQTATLALLGLGLTVLLPNSDPQPILHEMGLRLYLTRAGSSLIPCMVVLAVGAGEGLTQPIKVEVDAPRLQALAAAQELIRAGLVLRAANRQRLLAEPPQDQEQDYMDALSSLPTPDGWPIHRFADSGARATVAAAGVQLMLQLERSCAASEVCVAIGGVDIEAQGTTAGAVEVHAGLKPTVAHAAGRSKPLLELPRVDATVSLQRLPSTLTIQVRAGRLVACLSPEPLEGILRLLQSPATVPRHAAAAAVAPPSAPPSSAILTGRIEQFRLTADGARGPPPALPKVDVSFDGADITLPGRQRSTAAQALLLTLGAAHVRTSLSEKGGPRVAGGLEGMNVVLESVLAGVGRVQVLRMSRTSIDATYTAPTAGAKRPAGQQRQLGPQGKGDWLPLLAGQQGKGAAAPTLWNVAVSLPAIQAKVHLDHILEALWIAGGGAGAGLVKEHLHLQRPPANHRSRRQLHFLPADWAPWLAQPQLSLRLACPSIGVTLLHGSLYDGLPALGRPVIVESRPWAAAGAPAAGTGTLVDISLPGGLELRQTNLRMASSLDVEVPALTVSTSAAPETLRLVDLSGLRFSMRGYLANCHWTRVPGLESVLMGVAESSREVAVSLQSLDLGVEPLLLARVSHLIQALLQAGRVHARVLQPKRPEAAAGPSSPPVPLGPLLSVSVSMPGRTGVKLFWGGHGIKLGAAAAADAAESKPVAEIVMQGASVSVRAGRVGARLVVSGEVQDLAIVDGDAKAPELASVLCRYQRDGETTASPVPPMARWRFEGGLPAAGEGARFLLQAEGWRYVYLQRVLMELINYIKDYLIPLQQQVFAARPEDVLGGSVIHHLAAATTAPSPLLWVQGLPKRAPGAFSLPAPEMAFRLQISLVRSRVLLADASDAANGLIVDLDRYRFWRVRGGGSKGEAYWQGPELVALGEQDGPAGEADEEGLVFADPVNEGPQVLGLLEAEARELHARIAALSTEQAAAQAALHTEHAKLEAAQRQMDAMIVDGVRLLAPSPPPSPPPSTRSPRAAGPIAATKRPLSPGPLSARIASQMTAVDELERALSRLGQEVSLAKQRAGRVEAEVVRVRAACEKQANSRWQHGRALPVKPPNRFDMELVGASISTWRAGLIGKGITIHSYIEPGRLRNPCGDPETLYPDVHSSLGLKPYQGWDTNNKGVTVALFVHELKDWVLSRSQYTHILELLFGNCREPCLHAPPLRALPPPPEFEAISPGPNCLPIPACVSVPVYFERTFIRCVEDVYPAPSDGGLARGRSSELDLLGGRSSVSSRPSALSLRTIQSGSTWDEDDEQDNNEDEDDEEEDEAAEGATGAKSEGLWLDDDDAESEEEEEDIISAEENGSSADLMNGARAVSGALDDVRAVSGALDDVLSRPTPSWRNPYHPVIPDEYTATILLETACLSIDRRPNNRGLELSVTAEALTVLDEAPALRAALERAAAVPAPVKVLFPSSEVLPSSTTDDDQDPTTAAPPVTKLPGHLQIRYAQQNIGPYRRCSVEVARSVVAAAGDRIIRLVDFFLQPVRERNAKMPPPPQEQPKYMDVEVSLEETLACVLEDYRKPPHAALFALLRFEYRHMWRGFTEGGPGTVDATIALALQNVFFSRQGLVLERCLPLTTPFECKLQLLTDILKAEGGRPADRHRSLILNLRDLGDGCPTATAHKFRAMSLADAPSSSPSTLPHSSSSSLAGTGASKGPEIHIFLSVPDGRLFLKMASRLAVELNAGRQWTQALQQARAEEARQGALLQQQQGRDLPLAVVETPAAQGRPTPPQQLQQQQLLLTPSRSKTQIFISLDDVYLCLVNNALGVPIAYVALLGTDFRMQQQEAQQSSLDMSASVGLRAGYFNQRTFKWDSIVETVAVSADTRKDDEGAAASSNNGDQQQQQCGVAFQLTVLEPLDVNVTHALLSLTQNEALVTDLLVNRTSKTAPYVVRNRTGDRIDVSFRRNGQTVHASSLGDQEDCPFDFRDVVLAKLLQPSAISPRGAASPNTPSHQRWMTRSDALLHSLAFSLKGLNSSSTLSMDVVGLHDAGFLAAAATAAAAAPPPPMLISEVELQPDGSKVLTLRSRVCVQNKAGAPIYLLITADGSATLATTTSTSTARPNLSFSEEVLLQPEETKYISVALLGPGTALFVRASPAHGWAPLFPSLGDMDAFMEENADGASASLVCESPPLDEEVLQVPNDDSEDIFLAGSACIGVEVCTDQVRGGMAAGVTGARGGADRTASPASAAWASSPSSSFTEGTEVGPVSASTSSLLRASLSSLQQRDSFESVTGRDSLGDNSLLPGVKGETLYIRRHDAAAASLSLRNLVATVKRSTSGVGGGNSGGSNTSSRRPASARTAAASRAVRRIILRPAFVLHNLYPTPLLYRLCDKNGYVTAEGALPVGCSIPLFGACVKAKQYLSVRAANHLWSSYTRVHTPKAPYPLQERVGTMEMKSLSRWKGANGAPPLSAAADFDVPTQVVSVSLLGRHVRLFSKVAVCNRSSLVLDYRDGSLAADVASTLASGTSYIRQQPLDAGGPAPAPAVSLLLPPPAPLADNLCPPAIGLKVKVAGGAGAGDAAAAVALPRPVSSGALLVTEGSKPSAPPAQGSIVTVAVSLPFNHLDANSLQLPSSATLEELFAQLTEKVYLLRGASADDYEFVLHDAPAQSAAAGSASGRPSGVLSLGSGPASFSEQVQVLRSALASNRANLWDAAQAHLIGFRAGLVESVLDKSTTTLGSIARSSVGVGGRACVAVRLVHRVEVDVGFQIAQFTGRSGVAAALRPFVKPSAPQQLVVAPPRAQTPSSTSRLSGAPAQYQHPPLGVPFSPAVMLPGQSASGGSIQVAIRCWDSEWSGPLDVPLHQAVGTSAYSYLTLKQRGNATTGKDRKGQYDLGLIMRPCEPPFQRTSLLTLVPRYLLINRLDAPLEFSQAGCLDAWMGVLRPGEEAPFYWPWADRKKCIQVRIASPNSDKGAWQWSCDLPIDSLGELNLKLRTTGDNPHDKRIAILQVAIELVQGTITVSFSLQDPEFPPYRVDNFTSYNIRFRQTASLLSVGGAGTVGDWDYLVPSGSAAYAWDTPTVATGSTGGSKLLQLEFQQGSRWEQREYSLDELKRHSRIKLSRALPDLSRPLFEGYVDMQRSHIPVGGDAVSWRRTFCVLHDAVLYIFADEHKIHLRGVVNLGARGQAPGGRRTVVAPHKPDDSNDLFSVLRANLDRTTAKLNAILLSDDVQRGGQQTRSQARREVLGMVTFQLERYLQGMAAKAATPSSDGDASAVDPAAALLQRSASLRKQFSSRSPLLPANQWLSLMVVAGFARDAADARRLAADLVTTGHLVPLAAPGVVAGGGVNAAAQRRCSSAADTRPTATSSSDLECPLFKLRPPTGPPPKTKAAPGPATAFIASRRGTSARRLSVEGEGTPFSATDTTIYLLVVAPRDVDLESPSVGAEFEITTAFGDKSVFRCPSSADARRWIQALRDTVDRLAIASVLTASGSRQRPSSSKGGTLSGRWIGALVGDPLAPLQAFATGTTAPSPSSPTSTQIKAKTSVRVQVRCDGPTKVLELVEEHDGEEADEEDAAARLRKRRPLLEAGGAGAGGLFRHTSVGVYVRRMGISFVDDRPQETLYASFEHVNLVTDITPAHVTVGLTVEGLQVDNQLENAGFAVVLAPRPVTAKRRGGDQQQQQQLLTLAGLPPRSPDAAPAFHFFARRLNVASRDVVLFESFSCWVRPLELKLEESVLSSLLRMKSSVRISKHLLCSFRAGESEAGALVPLSSSSTVVVPLPLELDGNEPSEALGLVNSQGRRWLLVEAELLALQRPRAELLAGSSAARTKLYFEVLHLHPIDLTVSFKYMALQERQDEDKEMAILTNVAQLDNARVKLNALLVTDAFGARGHIARTILKHYYWGNPVGLVQNLGTGVKDFFYEPFEGMSEGSLEAFLSGLGKGTNSLLGNTMEGTFTAASKITGTLGHGLASLTLDRRYNHDRARRRAQEAQNVSEGIKQGGRELGRGFYEGVTGVVLAPVRGAERAGVMGFGKGLVKGLVGMAVKPAVGIVDFASKTTEGLRNFTRADILSQQGCEALRKQGRDGRVRPPRAFGVYGDMQEYDLEQALAQQVLHSVLKGRCKREHVVAHFPVQGWPHGLNALEREEAKCLSALKHDVAAVFAETLARDDLVPSRQVDIGPLFSPETATARTLELASIPENHVPMLLLVSEGRLLLVAGEADVIWEAPLGSLVDVAAVQLAGGTTALRFGLCTPASLAETTATVTAPRPSSGTAGGKALSLTRAGMLPAVYHPALQLELWLYALLERAMPPRLARLQRLTPPEDSCLLQGPMERRDSCGLLGQVAATHHRNYYVVAGNLLYEYRMSSSGGSGASSSAGGASQHPQPTPATLHMIVPLVGLRFSVASETVLRIGRARPGGEGFAVIKSTYTGPADGGPVIEHQALAVSRKEELTLVAPDAVAAREWLAVLAHAVVDELTTPDSPGGATISSKGASKAPAGPLPEAALPPSGKSKSPTAAALKPLKSFMGGGSINGSRSPRGGNHGGTGSQTASPRALTDPRRRRNCQLYVPFEPEVTLSEAEALARTIAQTQGLAATAAFGGGGGGNGGV